MRENLEHNDEEYNGSNCPSLLTKITRTKPYLALLSESSLRRSLSTVDLTLLGVGTALGIGIYVIIPKLSHNIAGTAVLLSIILTSFSVLLSGICYAEFSSRVPKCGSAYVYCYAALGEIWAFIVGWTIILEYVIVTAVLARTCSEYIDFIFGGRIYDLFKEVVTWNNSFLAPFPDFLALAIPVAVVLVVALGMRWAMIFNHAVFALSSIVLILLFVVSLFLVKPENWTHNAAQYGVRDILRAAAGGYFTFVGLEAITTASGETKRPQSSVPQSVILTVTLVTIIYCGITTVFILIIPFNQKSHLEPFGRIFQVIPGADYVAAIGAISAMLSGLLSCSLAAPRTLLSMASDGLLFGFDYVDELSSALKKVSFVHGFFSGCLAVLFTTEHLSELLSIGTLLAHTMVAISVLLARYQPGIDGQVYGKAAKLERINEWLQSVTMEPRYPTPFFHESHIEKPDTNERNVWRKPSTMTGYNASFAVLLLVMSLACLAAVLITVLNNSLKGEFWALLAGGISGLFTLAALISLTRQPRNKAEFSVMVPCFPWLPIITIFVNILLITELNYLSFIRFGAWLIPGLLIYALYGLRRSNEALKPKESSEGDIILYERPDVDASIKHIQPKTKRNIDTDWS